MSCSFVPLLASVFALSSLSAAQANFEVKPSLIRSLSVASPDSPEFRAFLTAHGGEGATTEIAAALNRSLLVRNNDRRGISVLITRYEYQNGAGNTVSSVIVHDFRRANRPFQSNSAWLATPDLGLSSAVNAGKPLSRPTAAVTGFLGPMLERMTVAPVSVSVDGVLFDDGHFFGADQSGTFAKLAQQRTAFFGLRREVEAMMESPTNEIHDWLVTILRDRPAPTAGGIDPVQLARTEMAGTLLSSMGAEGVEGIRKALNLVFSDDKLLPLFLEP